MRADPYLATLKVTLPKQPAGGSYNLSVSCTSGCTHQGATSIEEVTFGDVFMCTGQSNMELSLKFTFERNETIAKIVRAFYLSAPFCAMG